MEPVYIKKIINSEEDWPTADIKWYYGHTKDTDEIVRLRNPIHSDWSWIDWYLLPVQLPSEEEQIIYFNNHSATIEIKPTGLKLPLMTRSEVLKFADWLLSKLK